MHEARAGVFGDVIAFKKRDFEVVTACVQRMRRYETRRNDILQKLPLFDAGGLEEVFSQGFRQDEAFSGLGPVIGRRLGDLEQPVLDLVRKRDRAVAGDRPRRRRPDDEAYPIAPKRKLHPDRRARVLLILDLRLGERGAFHNGPHHGFRAAIQKPAHRKLRQLVRDDGLGLIGHRGV